jgi:hypothetical protein
MSENAAPASPGDCSDRVTFGGSGNRFAYTPHQIIVAGERGDEAALAFFPAIRSVVASTRSVDTTTSAPRVFTLLSVRGDIDCCQPALVGWSAIGVS